MKKFLSVLELGITFIAAISCCGTPDIAGKWNILKVNGEDVSIVGDERSPFIEFNVSEKRVHGFTGCNIMNGAYTMDGNKLTFGNMATTMMAGPEQNMKTEAAVLESLRNVNKVKGNSESLKFLDSEGKVVMELGK